MQYTIYRKEINQRSDAINKKLVNNSQKDRFKVVS